MEWLDAKPLHPFRANCLAVARLDILAHAC
jgi:hypothetical protein